MACGSNVDFVVVIAVDNSVHSEYAFNYYATEVHRPGYKVRVIHCSEAWVHCHKIKDPTVGNVQDMKTKEEEKVQEIKTKFTNMMQEHKIEGGEFDVVGGKDTWHQIIDYQEKHGAQLIVIGTRGSNVLRRTLLGSVSDSVVHHAHCPVLAHCPHAGLQAHVDTPRLGFGPACPFVTLVSQAHLLSIYSLSLKKCSKLFILILLYYMGHPPFVKLFSHVFVLHTSIC